MLIMSQEGNLINLDNVLSIEYDGYNGDNKIIAIPANGMDYSIDLGLYNSKKDADNILCKIAKAYMDLQWLYKMPERDEVIND